ncbi:hypothetical protein [Pseudonocardia nigra]|uniref:hypothetical protein n=1 Tax=Pseudonocardia nigra TaxID=1921578 RepID=UPI001C5EA6D6|nr:hypothetical protein [Pseudonocardia nigra]
MTDDHPDQAAMVEKVLRAGYAQRPTVEQTLPVVSRHVFLPEAPLGEALNPHTVYPLDDVTPLPQTGGVPRRPFRESGIGHRTT